MPRAGKRGETSESIARDYRLVPAPGFMLAAGRPGSGSLAITLAIVPAVSLARHLIRRLVRAASGHLISARAHVRLSRRYRGPALIACGLGVYRFDVDPACADGRALSRGLK